MIFYSGSRVMAVISTLLHFRFTNLTENHRVTCFKTHGEQQNQLQPVPTQANALAQVWIFYGSVPFLRKRQEFYGRATFLRNSDGLYYGRARFLQKKLETVSTEELYIYKERSQIYMERLRNSREKCLFLKITVMVLQNNTTFSSWSVVPSGSP